MRHQISTLEQRTATHVTASQFTTTSKDIVVHNCMIENTAVHTGSSYRHDW
jgi:hypothetical protein